MRDEQRRREYQKAYYQANKEILRAKQRARNKIYYQTTKEEHKARSRKWRAANLDRMRELQRQHRQRNREKFTRRNKQWYQANKERAAATSRRIKLGRYGLTQAQYLAMLAAQRGACAICEATLPSKRAESMLVDHCHKTGRVRGLLCRKCNSALGLFQESPQVLKRAAAYLTRSSSGAT